MSALVVNISRILSTFDISPVTGDDGKPQIPPFEFDVKNLS